ncbi:MAG: DUF2278 family protein [Anaerolineae bacterium]
MALKTYGVLKGRPLAAVPEFEAESPHYQVHMLAANVHYRIAINVKSNSDTNSELQYFVDSDFQHPLTQQLPNMSEGFTKLSSSTGGLALDFIRGNLFDLPQMRTLPFNVPGPDNDLNELIDAQIQRAIQDPNAVIYAFGERWGPEANKPDKVFKFNPGNGIHDIHMNQGNDKSHAGDDGVWQDGGLVIHFPTANRWIAVFLKFQSQAIHTDDRTGHRIDTVPVPLPQPEPQPQPGTPPPPEVVPARDGVIRIIAALVNPEGGDPEIETVILLNTSPQAIDLKGWALLDRMKHNQVLSGSIGAGDTLMIKLSRMVQLGNKGGLITLVDAQGLKVDGVSYTQEQAANEGWTVVF